MALKAKGGTMRSKIISILCFILFTLLFFSTTTSASEMGDYEFGVRGGVRLGTGVPANDIMAYGLFGRYRVQNNWLVGVAIDMYKFDFEYPNKAIGVENSDSKAIDSDATATEINLWIERRYNEKQQGFSFLWAAGFGINMVEAGDAEGPNSSGGFLIETDPGTEFVIFGTIGSQYHFNRHWAVEVTFGVNYHIAEWEVTDTVSGATGTIDNYTTTSYLFGVIYKF